MRDKWDEQHGDLTYGQMTVQRAIELTSAVYEPKKGKRQLERSEETQRLQIMVTCALIPELFDAAQAVLSSLEPPEVFQRDKLLVRIARLPEAIDADGIKRPKGALQITLVDHVYLSLLLTERADWSQAAQGHVGTVNAPMIMCKTVLSAAGRWSMPPLLGLLEAPTLLADGRYVQTPGYDRATGLFLDTGGVEFGDLPANPTREDALAALETLKAPFSQFPFVHESDRATLVAAILTALIRRRLPTAPLFAFRARMMATGKTLLVDAISIIATGRGCSVITQGKDEAEDQKRMLSILLAGDLVVSIDNIERPLGGADLCAILTGESYQGRVLGVSKMAKASTRVLFCATGNNMVIEGDLISRVLPCDLDAQCERPEEREFEDDFRQQLIAKRPALVRAALTVLRAYQVAGRPKLGLRTFGRFEEWSAADRARRGRNH